MSDPSVPRASSPIVPMEASWSMNPDDSVLSPSAQNPLHPNVGIGRPRNRSIGLSVRYECSVMMDDVESLGTSAAVSRGRSPASRTHRSLRGLPVFHRSSSPTTENLSMSSPLSMRTTSHRRSVVSQARRQSGAYARCAVCNELLNRRLQFRCAQCGDKFVVCEMCVDGDAVTQHDPSHDISAFVQESRALSNLSFGTSIASGPPTDSTTTESLSSSIISASDLTEREQHFVDVTGELPASLRGRPALKPEVETVEQILAWVMEQGSSCTELDLSHHALDNLSGTIDDYINRGRLQHIKELDVSDNCLTTFPDQIFVLQHLTHLFLGNNRLTELPDAICLLPNLKVLDLNSNRLTSLPSELSALSALESLVADFNRFVQLPVAAFSLVALETLYLQGQCDIASLSDALQVFSGTERVTSKPLRVTLDNHPMLVQEWKEKEQSCGGKLQLAWNPAFPDEILPGLFLGSIRSTLTPKVYSFLGIQSVFTVGRGLSPLIVPGMRHYEYIVDDIVGATVDFEGTDALRRELSRSGCLVHCHAGISRSATFVTAYLMKHCGKRLDEAFSAVRAGRPCVFPNDGFWQQLMDLDKRLFPNADPKDFTQFRGVPP